VKTVKAILQKYAENFSYFYRYLRYRIFIVIGLNILVGLLDGLGLTMFLPMLQMVNENNTVQAEKLGKLRFIVDGMESAGVSLTLFSVLLFLCIFFLLKGVARYISESYMVFVQQFFIRQVRLKMLAAFNRLSFKSFITSDVGRIQNTMSGEVDRVAKAFGHYFKSFEQFILAAVYMSFAFFIDAQFALLVTIGGGLMNLVNKQIYTSTKRASRKLTEDAHVFQGLIIQQVANFKYLKATGLLSFFSGKLKTAFLELEKSNKKIGILGAILTAAREPLLILVVSAVILIQTKLLGAPLGPILISLLFFYRALTVILGMQTAWNYFLGASGSLENMAVFQHDLEGGAETDGGAEVKQFKSTIVLKEVSLRYGNSEVLHNINLCVNKNETIAFAGESGSGKTTLVNILAGLLPVDGGEMKVDDLNRNDIKMMSFQERVGYITQDPVIFNDTIFNNVTFWAAPSKENMLRYTEAVKKASVAGFIDSLPEKENTALGNNGINLSGGQKQRISIARELFKNIDILIMDEATSALDSETERMIQDNIDALKGQYTILIVAHRLSTIKNADRIVLMNKGSIEQIGTYNELAANTSMFKRMVALQEL
jgi:ABC-type multidrug transport system fused ATPase/permease subunit